MFLLASGFTLIFGVMRIVNLAHGSFFLLGGYAALTVIGRTGSWLLAMPAPAAAVVALGLLMERFSLRPLGFGPLRQVLLTVGLDYLIQQAAFDIWGEDNLDFVLPAAPRESSVVGEFYFPRYWPFMIGLAVAIELLLWFVMERMGALLRATVDDAQMARGVGIDTSRVSMFIFGPGRCSPGSEA